MTTSHSPSRRSREPLPRGMATALNALRNGSRVPATPADVESILRTGRGDGSLVRALFGDVSLDTLTFLAIAFDIDEAALLASYATAKAEAAAAHPELDALIVRPPAARRPRPSS